MELEDALADLEWTKPKVVATRQGPRTVQVCEDLPKWFWSEWRHRKDEIKELGISIGKDDTSGEFVAKWWREPEDEELERAAEAEDAFEFEEAADQIIVVQGTLEAPPGYQERYPYLKPYQLGPVYTLLEAAVRPDVKMTLDASEMGLGKTWIAMAVAKTLGWNFGVVCPANVVTKWTNISMDLPFELEPEFVLSYDKLRAGKTPYLDRYVRGRGKKEVAEFKWNTSDNVVIIFDEVHMCANADSLNGRMLKAAIDDPFIYVHGMSGSVAESPLDLKTVGYGLALHDFNDHWEWCLRNGAVYGPFGGLLFNSGMSDARKLTKNQARARRRLLKIHHHIFPERGCRLRKSEIADQLPDNEIMAEVVDLNFDNPFLKEPLALLMEKETDDEAKAEEKGLSVSSLVMNTRDRQRSELGKCPTIFNRTMDLLDEGNSVIIFLNYRETIEVLRKMFTKSKHGFACLVGGLTTPQRNETLRTFQSNEKRIILVQLEAGSASIDLDDTRGTHPRAVLLSPTYSAKTLIQALARAHRTTTLSKVMQWILFSAGGVEERACRICQHKLNNMSLLNDGDLSGVMQVS